MRVLISGGGIAGLTLAYWLHEYGITSIIIEQAAGVSHDGYGLDFYGTGYDVAERMGLLEKLRERQLPFDNVAYVNDTGKMVICINNALMQKIMHQRYMALMRWMLEDVLHDALPSTVEIRYNTTLTAIRPGPDAVEVTFSDGTSDTFDLLIGADGVHSNTRRLVFGEDVLFERYLGYYFASYQLTDHYGIGHAWKNYVQPGRLASAYCSSQEDQIATFLMYKTPDEGRIPREQRLPRLRKVFAGMGWVTQQLLDDAPDPDAIFMDAMTQIHMPSWHQGRVALVGDACGCPTSLSGQGASMAMGGAYMLAEALHTAPDYASAFRQYEQRVRPYIEQRQENARKFAKNYLPGSPLGLVVQQIGLKFLLREAFSGLLRQQFGAESLLADRPAHVFEPTRLPLPHR